MSSASDASSTPRPVSASPAWLVGPWYDSFLIANLAWPVVVWLQMTGDLAARDGVQFWQLYYVTTPHRWITLALVFLDREQFRRRRGLFLLLAAAALLACAGVRVSTGALTCLLTIDYLWNAWHFAAQHHGIYRIYERRTGPGAVGGTVEKWALRLFLLYVIVRIATATWSDAVLEGYLRLFDWPAALVPLGLVARALWRPHARAGLTYLASVSALYLALLWAVHERRPGLVLALATASALFHALEYLALVSWSVRRRHAGMSGALGHLVPRWGIALSVFVLVLGAGGWFMDQHWLEGWLFLNVVVAFLHYAYDGLIWRRPAA